MINNHPVDAFPSTSARLKLKFIEATDRMSDGRWFAWPKPSTSTGAIAELLVSA